MKARAQKKALVAKYAAKRAALKKQVIMKHFKNYQKCFSCKITQQM